MQYIYFGLIPFLLAAWFVYRTYYKTDSKPDPMTSKDYRNVNFIYALIFTGIYVWLFGFLAGLLSGFAVLVIWIVWGNAIKAQELKRNPPSKYAEVSHDTYNEYEHYMNEKLGLKKKLTGKKAKRSK